jgi:hypothetical protein
MQRPVCRQALEHQIANRKRHHADHDLPEADRQKVALDARPFHVNGADGPAERTNQRQQQADRLLQRLFGDRIDQRREAGDA